VRLRIFHVLIAVLILVPFAFGSSVSSQSALPAQPAAARTAPDPAELIAPAAFSCDSVTEIPKIECEALVALHSNTNGPGWANSAGWLVTNTPCSWAGITCGQGHINWLQLESNNLQGSIPFQLGNLANLHWLNLGSNQLTGAIPPVLGNLANLQYIFLGSNQLTGVIPSQLGNLANLIHLDLQMNQLTGAIPSQLGNLANLHELYLRSNGLTGAIPPQLGNLANLGALSLWDNQLTGAIPPQLGNLASLSDLDLEWNQLTGTIPPELGNMANLRELRLNENQLTGAIPPQLGDLASLSDLDLEWNQLTGAIPPQLGDLANLQYLALNRNQLTGAIPTGLGNLANLRYLALNQNQLTGTIPPGLGNLANLQYLLLDSNQLTGTIPPELGNLADLRRFALDRNQLTGPIPPQLGDLANLTLLGLANNALEGEIPDALANLTNLNSTQCDYTDLGFNKLTASSPSVIAFLAGKDPDWVQTQTVAPLNLQAAPKPLNSVELTWTPILYTWDGGYYEVGYSATPGGPYSIYGRTVNKCASSYAVSSLVPGRTYYFAVRTYTPVHGGQQNSLLSGWSQEVSAAPPSPISHIEITQVTQDQGNTVPLIAGKLTFVRVYLDCGEGCPDMSGVTGVLHGYGQTGELPGSPVQSINAVIVRHERWQDQRNDLAKTLNFTLPPSWTSGTVTLRAEVTGTESSVTRSFEKAKSLRVGITPIAYQDAGIDKSPDLARIRQAHTFAAQLYPTSDIQVIEMPGMSWSGSCFGTYCGQNECDTVTNAIKAVKEEGLMTRMWLSYQWYNLNHASSEEMDFTFGWLPEGTYGGGLSYPVFDEKNGKTAFGDDHPTEGARIFAHEIGHLLGRRHTNTVANKDDNQCARNNCPVPSGYPADQWEAFLDPDSDWVIEDGTPNPPPFPDSKIQDYGLDGYHFGWLVASSGVINPNQSYDFMSYCGALSKSSVWTSPWTYRQMYEQELKVAGTAVAAQTALSSQSFFLASGLVRTNDTATLDPIWVITSAAVPESPPAGTTFCLEAQDAGGTALASHCFDLAFVNYETGVQLDVDGFNLLLPYPPGTARIALRKGMVELAVRSVSPHAPEVTVLSPNGGESWGAAGSQTITWSASDFDGNPLTYSVLYSPDGKNWLSVSTGLTVTHAAVNTSELAGGSMARIRVLATDGVNTESDESDVAFSVERKGPQAHILSPEGNLRIIPGTPLLLQGYAYDLEDGTLSESALRWTSVRDGELGTGSQALVTLSPGPHVITLTATDSDGNTAKSSIEVYGGAKLYLPVALSGG
jgi:Leucine-rich repeat (LRR) protein